MPQGPIRQNPLLRPQLPVFPGQMNPQADGMEVPDGLGPAPFKPSQPRGADPSRRIVLPGCDFPPADAFPVDEVGDGNVLAGATATLVTVRVPDNLTFRISGIGFDADDQASLRFATWTIIATPPGAPIVGYNLKPATVGSIRQVSYIFAVMGSSVVIEVRLTNNNAVQLYFVSRLLGWFYAEKEAL